MDEFDRGRTNAGSIDHESLSHSTADWVPDDLAPEAARVPRPPPRRQAKRRLAAFAAILGGIALLAGGSIYQHRHAAQRTAAAVPSPAIPVTVAAAVVQDVPTYQRAVGTVQAYNTVTVSSRVDGQIVGVGFIEGQERQAGR